jgi:hypothetical protein
MSTFAPRLAKNLSMETMVWLPDVCFLKVDVCISKLKFVLSLHRSLYLGGSSTYTVHISSTRSWSTR